MVTFLTLFLGLVIGEQKIELAVDDRVASVEVMLDQTLVGVVRGPPWSITCDFGETLAPHLLEAVARDREGRELDRAAQRVNLPREPAEVSLALRGGEQGYREVEIGWHAPGAGEPEEVRLAFDGEPLRVFDRRATLPPHDPQAVHVVTADVVFPGQLRATGELAFGGKFGEEVRSELTAVPVVPRNWGARRHLPSAAEIEGWLRVAGSAPRVVAVESVPFELIVVRDQTSLHLLRRLREPARKTAKIQREQVLRFVSSRPVFTMTQDGTQSALFSVSENVNPEGWGLGWATTNRFFGANQEGPVERLTEAVAVAGLQAAGSNRPRGVLLVSGAPFAEEVDPGLDPLAIRAYLATLHVPFFYWRLDQDADRAPDSWGSPRVVLSRDDLHRAAAEVATELRAQFLVWLEGEHMPGEVSTAAGSAKHLRLAGAVVR